MKILAIEDDPGDIELLRRHLRNLPNLQIELADRLSAGLKRLSENPVDLVILDLGLPDSQGLETLTRFRSQVADIPVVVLTGMSDETLGVESSPHGRSRLFGQRSGGSKRCETLYPPCNGETSDRERFAGE